MSDAFSEIDNQDLNILLVDDDQFDRELISQYLNQDFAVHLADDAAAAIEFCGQQIPDCVIIDYNLGTTNGLILTSELKRIPGMRYVPLIMLTGIVSIDTATQAFKAGADDYLRKQQVSKQELVYAIKAACLKQRLLEAQEVERHSLVQRNLEIEKRHRLMTEYWLGIAHTLLTPLASTQEFISLVLDGVGGELTEQQGKYLGYARGGCSTIEAAVLRMAKMADLASDPGELSWNSEPLIALLEQALDEVRIEGRRLGIEIRSNYLTETDVFGDRSSILQLVHLLTQRCLWYASQDGVLTVSCMAGCDPDLVLVTLEGSTDHPPEALVDEMEWQLTAALTQANASDFNAESFPGGIRYSFQLLKSLTPSQLNSSTVANLTH